MELETLRLLFDFGLTVLIWMVQLVVYPSFLHYSKSDLVRWHHQYTGRIAYLVIPLMVVQLVVTGWQLFYASSIYSAISFSVVIFLWGFTFTHFAPLHGTISASNHTSDTLKKLVDRNWIRTGLWSILLVYGIMESMR